MTMAVTTWLGQLILRIEVAPVPFGLAANPRLARRHFFYHGRQRILTPDAAGVYLIGNQVYEFPVESDMGTHHKKSLLQKFTVFRDCRDSTAYHRDRVRLPLVLVVTAKGNDRTQELAAAAVAAGAVGTPEGGPGMTFLIASQADIEAHGLHHPIWLDAAPCQGLGGLRRSSQVESSRTLQGWAAGQRQYCFAGLKDIPDSARMRLDLREVQHEVMERLRYRPSVGIAE